MHVVHDIAVKSRGCPSGTERLTGLDFYAASASYTQARHSTIFFNTL